MPGTKVYVFYMDVRTPGKLYDEFYNRTREEYGVEYVRGRVSKIYQDGEQLMVKGEDTLLGKQVEIAADMVILANAMIPQTDSEKWRRL